MGLGGSPVFAGCENMKIKKKELERDSREMEGRRMRILSL
jgi:hypothetical protein